MKTQDDIVRDLAFLVKRLAHAAPLSVRKPALDYLQRYNLLGDPLRADDYSPVTELTDYPRNDREQP